MTSLRWLGARRLAVDPVISSPRNCHATRIVIVALARLVASESSSKLSVDHNSARSPAAQFDVDRALTSSGPWYRVSKRVFDVAVSLTAVVMLSPVMVMIAILIKLESRGPVFYRGLRTGVGGRSFKIFKFRTMYSDRADHGPLTTSRDDPRRTRLGIWLRRYKLDELPQLLDVLRGRMSLVGPRPEFPQFTALYTREQRSVLGVRPGITDRASIEFRHLDSIVGEADPDEAYFRLVWRKKMVLRMFYVSRRSFLLDIKILARTLKVLVGGR